MHRGYFSVAVLMLMLGLVCVTSSFAADPLTSKKVPALVENPQLAPATSPTSVQPLTDDSTDLSAGRHESKPWLHTGEQFPQSNNQAVVPLLTTGTGQGETSWQDEYLPQLSCGTMNNAALLSALAIVVTSKACAGGTTAAPLTEGVSISLCSGLVGATALSMIADALFYDQYEKKGCVPGRGY